MGRHNIKNMNEDTGQERLALIGSLVIFASLLGLVLVLLLIEYVLDGSDNTTGKYANVKTDANDSTKADAQEVKVDDADDLKTPKYGPLRKASQKLQQLFLNYPS